MSKKNSKPRASWQTITPERAKELLETQLSNRRINQRRVASAAEDIVAGRWVENGESIKLTVKGNLIDGQHRLAAIVKANKPVSTLVVDGLPEKVMATIDQGRARSNSDVLGLLGVNNSTQAAAVTRGLWEMDKFKALGARVYPPRSEVVRMYREHSDEIQDGLLATHVLRRNLVPRTSAALTYILLSRVNSHAVVDQFIQAIVNEDPAPAIKALRRFTMNNPHRVRQEKFVPILIKAWNAWVTEAKVDVLGFRIGESFPDIAKASKNGNGKR